MMLVQEIIDKNIDAFEAISVQVSQSVFEWSY